MSIFDDIVSNARRSAKAPKANEPVDETGYKAPRGYSGEAVKRRAKEINQGQGGAFDAVLSNVQSAFRGAGTLANQSANYVVGEDRIQDTLKAAKSASELYRKSPILQGLTSVMPGVGTLFRAPTSEQDNLSAIAPKVTQAGGAAMNKLSELYNRAVWGVDPNQGEKVKGKKFKEKEAELVDFEEAAQNIAAAQRGEDRNVIERIGDAAERAGIPGAGGIAALFDRRVPDVADAATKAGYSPQAAALTSIFANPLELIGAPAKGSVVKNVFTGKATPVGARRLAFNRAAKVVVDPVQSFMDIFADASVPLKQAAKNPSGDIAKRISDQLGISPDELQRRIKAQEAPPLAKVESTPEYGFDKANLDLQEQFTAPAATAPRQFDAMSAPNLKDPVPVPEPVPAPSFDSIPVSAMDDLGLPRAAGVDPILAPDVAGIPESAMPASVAPSAARAAKPVDPAEALLKMPTEAPPRPLYEPIFAPKVDVADMKAQMGLQDLESTLPPGASLSDVVEPPVSLNKSLVDRMSRLLDEGGDRAVVEKMAKSEGPSIDEMLSSVPGQELSPAFLSRMEAILADSQVAKEIASGKGTANEFLDKFFGQQERKAIIEKAKERLARNNEVEAAAKQSGPVQYQPLAQTPGARRDFIGVGEASIESGKALTRDAIAKQVRQEKVAKALDSTLAPTPRTFLQRFTDWLTDWGDANPKVQGKVKLNASVGGVEEVLNAIPGMVTGKTMAKFEKWVESAAPKALAQAEKLPLIERVIRAGKSTFTTSQGIVPMEVGRAIEAMHQEADSFSRAVVDTFHSVSQGDLRPILGRDAVHSVLDAPQKELLRKHMTGAPQANGLPITPKVLENAGIHPDFIDAARVVRALQDKATDELLSEQWNLPRDWFGKLQGEQRKMVQSLAESARKPMIRASFDKGVQAKDAAFYAEAKAIVDNAVDELEARGLLTDEGLPVDMLLPFGPALTNRGKYDPRSYTFFETGVPDGDIKAYLDAKEAQLGKPIAKELRDFIQVNYGNRASSKAVFNEASRLKARKDIPLELKEILTEIQDPIYTFSKGIYQVNQLRNKLEFRRWAAAKENFVSRGGESLEEFIARTKHDATDIIALDEGNIGTIGTKVNFGALRGRFIHKDFADSLVLGHIIPTLGEGPGFVGKGWDAITDRWKYWHTVANPSSHARQAQQNIGAIFDVAGFKGLSKLPDAWTEYFARGDRYAEARRAGLFQGKYIGELANFIDDAAWREMNKKGLFGQFELAIEKIPAIGNFFADAINAARTKTGIAAEELWQASDDIARLALFNHFRSNGYEALEAAKLARSEVYLGAKNTPLQNFLRGKGVSRGKFLPSKTDRLGDVASAVFAAPFISASMHLSMMGMRSMLGVRAGHWMPGTDPMRAARSMGVMMGMQWMNEKVRAANGMSTQEEIEARPRHLFPLLPTFLNVPDTVMELIDDKGRRGYVNMAYMFALGNMAEGGFDAEAGRMYDIFSPKPGGMKLNVPMVGQIGLHPVLQTVAESLSGKNFFLDSELYARSDDFSERLRKGTSHAWRQIFPVWAPNALTAPAALMDAIRYDGGKDGKNSFREFVGQFLQGIANDGGHLASKGASAIFNSFDYWWEQNYGKFDEAMRVQDYSKREYYLAKFFLDAVGLKVDSTTKADMKRRDSAARRAAIASGNSELKKKLAKTSNPQTRRQLQRDFADMVKRVKKGKPEPRLYDQYSSDTLWNVMQAITQSKGLRNKEGPIT